MSGPQPDTSARPGSFGFTSFDADTVPAEQADALPNDYDFAFAVMMIPHHQAAVDMANMLLMAAGLDPLSQELGEWIAKDQQSIC